MFFYISKIFWFFAQPSNLIIILLVAGAILHVRGKVISATRIIAFCIIFIALAGLSPLSYLLMLSLEQQYSKPQLETSEPPDGIIVLGGMIDTAASEARNEITLNNGAERLTEAARLAHRFPDARIMITGGVGAIIYRGSDEATFAQRFLTDLGIASGRILIEKQSRNTWQNAVHSREIIQPKQGERWLLITSAFHMPRAAGVFRAAGFAVIPWPVDYRTRGDQDIWRIPTRPSEAWSNVDIAVKEWIGYAAYALSGRLK
jgi:uncharacterized SAM-binding protein YcdF (DUF218 family)